MKNQNPMSLLIPSTVRDTQPSGEEAVPFTRVFVSVSASGEARLPGEGSSVVVVVDDS